MLILSRKSNPPGRFSVSISSSPIKYRMFCENPHVPSSNEHWIYGYDRNSWNELIERLEEKNPDRLPEIRKAFYRGIPLEKYHGAYVYPLNKFFSYGWTGVKYIMQFTGYYERIEKEIYECDICEFDVKQISHDEPALKDRVGVVAFQSPGSLSFGGWQSEYVHNIKVLGNVFDNPDLIPNEPQDLPF